MKTPTQASEWCQRVEELADLAIDLHRAKTDEDAIRYNLYDHAKRWAPCPDLARAYADAGMARAKIKLAEAGIFDWHHYLGAKT